MENDSIIGKRGAMKQKAFSLPKSELNKLKAASCNESSKFIHLESYNIRSINKTKAVDRLISTQNKQDVISVNSMITICLLRRNKLNHHVLNVSFLLKLD